MNVIDNEFVLKKVTLDNANYQQNTSIQDLGEIVSHCLSTNDFSKIKQAIERENNEFLSEVSFLKDKLDELTDVMENDSLISIEKLKDFKRFLEKHTNLLAKNIN